MREVCEAAVDKETEAAPLSAPAAVCSPQCSVYPGTPPVSAPLCTPHSRTSVLPPALLRAVAAEFHTRLGWTHGDTLGHGHQPSSGEFGVYALRTHASDSQGREIS